jgi:hypothetical protein
MLDQRLCAGELGARLDQRGLQFIGVVGKWFRYCRGHGATESQQPLIRRHYSPARWRVTSQPAACGRKLWIGLRQSIPSNMYDSCAGVITIAPSVACGQMKRPRSSRLA